MALVDDCVHYWTFDSDATDSVGSLDGTVFGATNTTGKINNAYDYEASSSNYIDIGYGTYTVPTNFTFSSWVYMESNSGSFVFCTKNSAKYEYGLYINGGDNAVYVFHFSGVITFSTSYPVSTGAWHHLAIVKSGVNFSLYIDGSFKETKSIASFTTSTGRSTFGRRGTNADFYFDGLIDEVGFWEVALTSTDISDLYNSGSGLSYPFSGGAETTYDALMIAGDI